MDNQQLCDLKQVLLSARLGDGCFYRINENRGYKVSFSSCNLDYMEYKQNLIKSIASSKITGYKQTQSYKPGNFIYTFVTKNNELIEEIVNWTINEILNQLDELGLALWFYDDGTLHKDKNFYQLSTHSFDKETQENIIIPYLKDRWNIIAKLTSEKKKNGKEYWYLRIGKYDGSFIISEILSKFKVKSLMYKLWSSETNQQWCKLQEELKRKDLKNLTNMQLGCIIRSLNKI